MKGIAVIGLASVALASGCASMVGASAAINNEKLVERTAFALGLQASDITILDRQDEGTSARYRARTAAGKMYNCTVDGARLPLQSFASDALCTEVGKATGNPLLRK